MNNQLLKKEIERSALKFRGDSGYGPSDPIHLTSLLLKRNVITLFRPLTGGLSGMAIKAPGDMRFMLINQTHIIGRQHFSIGHELYHLFIQKDFTSQQCSTALFENQTDNEEKNADMFAAFLLLPEQGIVDLIPNEERLHKNKIKAETIFKIQQYFSLSINAVIYRLIELGYIDKSYYNKFAFEKKSIARKLGYDMALYEAGNANKVIGDYGLIVNKLYEEKKISETYYLELLNAINIDPFAPSENGSE
ncbi:MAG: ImmA/IrrE family metallo-endopeptidase [Bacteroidota bacterium]